MKSFVMATAIVILAGCSGMGMHTGSEGASGSSDIVKSGNTWYGADVLDNRLQDDIHGGHPQM